jgi:subtilisin family serine protease
MGTVLKHSFRSALAKGLSFSLLLLFSKAAATAALGANTSRPELKRYLVFSEAEAAKAVAQGARVVRVTKGLKAVVCVPALAQALGLMADIRVQAADTAANTQILATRVQDLGLTGRGRKIVVLDTGYNYTHPELRSSYLGGTNFVSDNGDPFDNNGHGSHVAGIITGDGIDARAKGIAPDAGIIAGKVLDANGLGYISDVAAGIYWAVDGPDGYFGTADDFKADAINISIGTSGTDMYPTVFCDAATPSLTDAIRYARDHGVVVVIAAGNNGSSGVSLPGCVSYSLTVGAIDRSNVLASFSGTGPSVDLVAPGVALYSAWLGSNYKTFSGTSQATPMVSGTIALLKEAFPNASVQDCWEARSIWDFLGRTIAMAGARSSPSRP